MEKKTLEGVQFDALNTYFNTLSKLGYMNDYKTVQILVATFLIDTLTYFQDYVDDSYIKKIESILRSLKCCNCAIDWDSYKVSMQPVEK